MYPRTGHGTQGYTDPKTKTVVVEQRLSGPQQASTIAHELGHVHGGHVDGDYQEYVRYRSQMETEAERPATWSTDPGMSRDVADPFSPGHIASWSRGKTETVTSAMDRSTKASTRS